MPQRTHFICILSKVSVINNNRVIEYFYFQQENSRKVPLDKHDIIIDKVFKNIFSLVFASHCNNLTILTFLYYIVRSGIPNQSKINKKSLMF
jgi:hypothetical protein